MSDAEERTYRTVDDLLRAITTDDGGYAWQNDPDAAQVKRVIAFARELQTQRDELVSAFREARGDLNGLPGCPDPECRVCMARKADFARYDAVLANHPEARQSTDAVPAS